MGKLRTPLFFSVPSLQRRKVRARAYLATWKKTSWKVPGSLGSSRAPFLSCSYMAGAAVFFPFLVASSFVSPIGSRVGRKNRRGFGVKAKETVSFFSSSLSFSRQFFYFMSLCWLLFPRSVFSFFFFPLY